ncbi:MAG: hypothetical protein ABFC73_09225, partial [Clostridiaceae bacterium]
ASVISASVFSAQRTFKGAVRSRSQLPLFLLVYCSTPTIDGEPIFSATGGLSFLFLEKKKKQKELLILFLFLFLKKKKQKDFLMVCVISFF